MKKHLTLIAAALATLTVGAARADDGNRPLTREEVVASVMAARQSGELAALNAGGSWTAPTTKAAPQMTRDQVAASVLEARKTGELAALNAGGSWTPPNASTTPISRDKVVNDFLASQHQPSDASAVEHSL